MAYSKNNDKPCPKAWLLGIGLDKDKEKDAPLRVTRGENYRLVGGSRDTHGKMQEVAIHVNEDLRDRGKTLDDAEPAEIRDIVQRAAEKTED